MATDSKNALLIGAVEHLQTELADLPESKTPRPRLYFSLSNRIHGDPSATALDILRRLARTAGITDDNIDPSKLSRQLLAWWSDKKAPPEARTYPREFRAHVRALIREATDIYAQSRIVQDPHSQNIHVGKLIGRRNGRLFARPIPIRSEVKKGYKELGYSTSNLTTDTPNIRLVVDVVERVMDECKAEAVELFNVHRGVPITECAAAATDEILGIFPSSAQIDAVRAVADRLRKKYSSEFVVGDFLPEFTAALSQKIETPLNPQTMKRSGQTPR